MLIQIEIKKLLIMINSVAESETIDMCSEIRMTAVVIDQQMFCFQWARSMPSEELINFFSKISIYYLRWIIK